MRLVLLLLAGCCALVLTTSGAPAIAQVPAECEDTVDNDLDGFIDDADDGCVDGTEDGSAYSEIVRFGYPLAVVTIRGRARRSGAVQVQRMQIRAIEGARVRVRCQGRRCPSRTVSTTMEQTTLRLRRFERKLPPGTILTFTIGQPGQLAKYTRFAIRRKKAPARVDACVAPGAAKPSDCFKATD